MNTLQQIKTVLYFLNQGIPVSQVKPLLTAEFQFTATPVIDESWKILQ